MPYRASIPDVQIDRLAACLQAMASPLRLKIVCLLASGEMNVGEIVAATGSSQPNISQHLTLLTDRGLVAGRKEANRVIYHLRSLELIRLLAELPGVCC